MTGLKDGKVLANHRHVAFVVIPKRPAVLASPDPIGDHPSDKSTLLNGGLRHAGDGVPVLGHRGCISDDKDVRRLADVHESAYEGAPSAVHRRTQHFYD